MEAELKKKIAVDVEEQETNAHPRRYLRVSINYPDTKCHRYKLGGSGRRHGLINLRSAAWVYGRSEKVQS